MGAYRDEQMFREMDARESGYRDGRNTAESIATSVLSDVLGINPPQIDALQSLNLEEKIFALEDVAKNAAIRAIEARRLYESYSSDNAGVVAEVIFDGRVTEDDTRGYSRTSDYRFFNDVTGLQVQTGRFMHTWLEIFPISGEWVSKHLGFMGFERDERFCTEIAAELSMIAEQRTAENG